MANRSVLIVNMGSSSLKWVVLDAGSEVVLNGGEAHWTSEAGGQHQADLAAALRQVPAVDAVAHRVVHGGARFTQAVRIDDQVRHAIEDLADLAPLHNPAAVAGMRAAAERFPDLPQVATFDSGFHASMPEPARTYPLPWDWTTTWGLRRFGFHGLSVEYAVARAAEMLGQPPARSVVCHLGAGCSVTAVASGQSVETSMGFTPLEGLMMAQRSGSIDPGLLLYLLNTGRVDTATLDRMLNQASGLLGVSGVSANLREIQAAADAGVERARLAIDMFVHRLVATIGRMVPVLGGLDLLVFTGGIGERSAPVRAATCESLSYLDLRLDRAANHNAVPDVDVSAHASRVRVLVIAAREDLAMLRQTRRVLGWE